MEPPGTYSRKMLKCSFVRSVPCGNVTLQNRVQISLVTGKLACYLVLGN